MPFLPIPQTLILRQLRENGHQVNCNRVRRLLQVKIELVHTGRTDNQVKGEIKRLLDEAGPRVDRCELNQWSRRRVIGTPVCSSEVSAAYAFV